MVESSVRSLQMDWIRGLEAKCERSVPKKKRERKIKKDRKKERKKEVLQFKMSGFIFIKYLIFGYL